MRQNRNIFFSNRKSLFRPVPIGEIVFSRGSALRHLHTAVHTSRHSDSVEPQVSHCLCQTAAATTA